LLPWFSHDHLSFEDASHRWAKNGVFNYYLEHLATSKQRAWKVLTEWRVVPTGVIAGKQKFESNSKNTKVSS
jgi:hypothetical protein